MKSDSASRSRSPSGPVIRSIGVVAGAAVAGSASLAGGPASAAGGPGVRGPPRRDHPAAERRRETGDRLADRAETDDADGHVAQLGALQRLPGPLALELEQLGQPATDGQDHHQDVLGDRVAEDAAGVRHDEPALPAGRGQDALDAGRGRVDPGQARRTGEQPVERLGRQEAAQEHLDVVERSVGQALRSRP